MSSEPRPPLLERFALHRPELRAWAMYDWGNSAFFTTVVATVFPLYLGRITEGVMTEQESTQHLVWITAAALGSIAIFSPLLGAAADFSGNRKRWFTAFMVLGVGSRSWAVTVPRSKRACSLALLR